MVANEQLQLTLEERVPFLTADEIYDTPDATLLCIIKENRRIERKPAGIHPQPLAQYFSMWANTPPDGELARFFLPQTQRLKFQAALSDSCGSMVETKK